MNSKAIFYSDDAAFCAPLFGVLAARGWDVVCADRMDSVLAAPEDRVAVIVLDAHAPQVADLLAQVRAQPQPAGGVPVLVCGGAGLAGASASVPADDALPVATVERFTGDLGDHALRRAPFSPFYRLVRLLGTRDAATMIDRFADSLRGALADDALTPAAAHRLAGIAGAVGYTALAHAWRSAEQGDEHATEAAIAATRATLVEIARSDLARYRADPA